MIKSLPGRFTTRRAKAHRKPAHSGFPKPDSMTATELQFFVEPPDIQDDNFYSGVYDAADSGSAAIEQQVNQAFAKLRSIVTMEQLAAAIESNTLDQVLEGVDFANFQTDLQNALRVTILAVVDKAGTESAKLLQDQVAGAPAPLPEDHQKSSWKVQYSPSSQAAVDWAKQYTANLVSQVTDETKKAIREAVVAGIQAGKTNAGRRGQPIAGIAKDIHPLIGLTTQQAATLGNYRTQLEAQATPQPQVDKLVAKKAAELLRGRAELIAKTEGIKAMNQGQYFTWQQAVADKTLNDSYTRRIWVTYGDERVCPVCAGLSTQTVKMDEPFIDMNGTPLMTPGAHPACVVGSTQVTSLGRIDAASKRMYQGYLITLHSGGEQLTCTPNHPVLTNRGWVAAGLLHKGDQVVSNLPPLGRRFGEHSVDVPPRIEDVVDSFLAQALITREVPTTAQDFHGDGVGSQVAVIGADCLLGNSYESTPLQDLKEQLLITAPEFTSLFAGLGAPEPPTEGNRLSLERCVRCGNLMNPLTQEHIAPFHSFRLALGSEGDSPSNEAIMYVAPTNAVLLCQTYAGRSLPIFLGQLSNIDRIEKAWVSSRHVYNLETSSSIYIANNIITHNCRCRQSLTFVTPEPAKASEYVEPLQFFNPNHDAEGHFATGGGFGTHQGKINELFKKLDSKAKGGKITESAAYHAGKELKEHAKAALADPSMSAEEHAHLSSQLKAHTGMTAEEAAGGKTMAMMHTLQGEYKPGAHIADALAAKAASSSAFALHQKSLNDAFAGLDAKAKNGVISDHHLYHEGKALTQAAKFVVADTGLTAEERAHINTQLKAHTGMTAEEMVNASQIKVRDSLHNNYAPGKKIADMGLSKGEPAIKGEPQLSAEAEGIVDHLNGTMSKMAPHGAFNAFYLKNVAKKITNSSTLSPVEAAHLSSQMEKATGMSADSIVKLSPGTVNKKLEDHLQKTAPTNANVSSSSPSSSQLPPSAPSWMSTLTASELSAVKSYTSTSYHKINSDLRKGEPPTLSVHRLDSAFKKVPPQHAMTVLRSATSIAMPSKGTDMIGKSFTDLGYVSTTMSTQHVFGGNIKLTIHLPEGHNGMPVNTISHFKGENELLLPRGSNFKVINAHQTGNEWHYEVEYLGTSPTQSTEPRQATEETGSISAERWDSKFTWHEGDLIWN